MTEKKLAILGEGTDPGKPATYSAEYLSKKHYDEIELLLKNVASATMSILAPLEYKHNIFVNVRVYNNDIVLECGDNSIVVELQEILSDSSEIFERMNIAIGKTALTIDKLFKLRGINEDALTPHDIFCLPQPVYH